MEMLRDCNDRYLASDGHRLAKRMATVDIDLAKCITEHVHPRIHGWVGMPVNLGAAMIAAVSMGLSVDSTLHYLMRMKREMAAGASPGGGARSDSIRNGFWP